MRAQERNLRIRAAYLRSRYYAMLAKATVHHFQGNNNELGTACGKYYRCSVMSIIDAGDSDILRSLEAPAASISHPQPTTSNEGK